MTDSPIALWPARLGHAASLIHPSSMLYAFGPIELDTTRAELRADGEPRPVERQVFALLAYLAEHRDRLASKDELFDSFWEGRMVTDSTLSKCIRQAPQAVGDDGQTPGGKRFGRDGRS